MRLNCHPNSLLFHNRYDRHTICSVRGFTQEPSLRKIARTCLANFRSIDHDIRALGGGLPSDAVHRSFPIRIEKPLTIQLDPMGGASRSLDFISRNEKRATELKSRECCVVQCGDVGQNARIVGNRNISSAQSIISPKINLDSFALTRSTMQRAIRKMQPQSVANLGQHKRLTFDILPYSTFAR